MQYKLILSSLLLWLVDSIVSFMPWENSLYKTYCGFIVKPTLAAEKPNLWPVEFWIQELLFPHFELHMHVMGIIWIKFIITIIPVTDWNKYAQNLKQNVHFIIIKLNLFLRFFPSQIFEEAMYPLCPLISLADNTVSFMLWKNASTPTPPFPTPPLSLTEALSRWVIWLRQCFISGLAFNWLH